jgi:hypothetical protein
MHPPVSENTIDRPASAMLEGYLSENEYARQRGVSIRTCQRDRALRQSPPHVIIGRQVYYRIEAVREWLLSRENNSTRLPQSLAGKRGRS